MNKYTEILHVARSDCEVLALALDDARTTIASLKRLNVPALGSRESRAFLPADRMTVADRLQWALEIVDALLERNEGGEAT